jgi:hypothetical protein
LSLGFVFVAQRETVVKQGLDPYRKKAKRMIYQEKCNSVYLMARDDNISAVREVREAFQGDGRVDGIATYEYRLRRDFAARRRLRRERAIIVAMRAYRGTESAPADDADLTDGPLEAIEIFDPESSQELSRRHKHRRT